MMNRSLWVVVTAVAMWHAPAGAQEPIAPSQVQASQPSKSIKVPIESDNRHLAFTVWGDHGPSIIIEGGGGHASSATGEWDKVAKALSENNRVYLYDRAGLGDSGSPSKLPRTSADIAADLHQAIDAANIPTPVVLVGFSLGGMHSLVFANAYPKQVAGIVLVDSSHADQDETWYHALPVESSTEAEPVKQARSMLHSRLEDRGETGERLDMVASREQVRSIKSLGTIPLVVLTHSPKYKVDPRLPDDLLNAIESHSQRLQKQFLALSSHSKQIVAKEAGHAIHVDEPELVIAAINALRTKVD